MIRRTLTYKVNARVVINIFFDANIWIDYSWYYHISGGKGKRKKSVILIDEIEKLKEKSRYMIILSPFLISEISQHFTNWFLLKKVIADGFSYKEFLRERKNYNLSKEEKETIDDIIRDIGSKTSVNVLDIKDLKTIELEYVLKLRKYYIDFYDAFHIYTALNKRCKYFVTKDGELRKRFQKMISDGIIKEKIKLLTEKGFLKILNKNLK